MFDILKFLEDAPVRLTHGKGTPQSGGCWMSALSVYAGHEWSDHPECVCPIIRDLAIMINDWLPTDKDRGEIIGPVILEPIGTASDDVDVLYDRFLVSFDCVVRRLFPMVLEELGAVDRAHECRSLPMVARGNAHEVASKISRGLCGPVGVDDPRALRKYLLGVRGLSLWVRSSTGNLGAFGDRKLTHHAIEVRKDAIFCWSYAVLLLMDDSMHAYAASRPLDVQKKLEFVDRAVADFMLPALLEMCSIGNKAPVEPSCEELQLRRALQCSEEHVA